MVRSHQPSTINHPPSTHLIVTFQPTGALSATTIADYTASPKISGVFASEFGLEVDLQIEKRYNSDVPFIRNCGNARGEIGIITRCSLASYDAASAYLASFFPLLTLASPNSGSLIIKPTSSASHTLSMANSFLKSVKRLQSGDMEGIGVALHWVFAITTIAEV